MSSIQQILASILNAVYGKDVRQAIHDGVEMAYNKADDAATSAAAAAEAASGSQESAAASAQAASNSASRASDSADLAEQYKNEAFHTTPAGYETFVGEVNSSLDYLVETGVKNLLPNDLWSQTINTVQISVNKDGSFSANGTAGGYTHIVIYETTSSDEYNKLFAGKTLKLSGCPSGGSNSTYRLQALMNNGVIESKYDTGNGITIVMPTFNTSFKVEVWLTNGYVASNLLFKPMMTLSIFENSDYAHYVPYAKSNTELTHEWGFIDYHNVIVSRTNLTYPYTATENCWVAGAIEMEDGYGAEIHIDGILVAQTYSGDGTKKSWAGVMVPLKKGQVLSKNHCAAKLQIYGMC